MPVCLSDIIAQVGKLLWEPYYGAKVGIRVQFLLGATYLAEVLGNSLQQEIKNWWLEWKHMQVCLSDIIAQVGKLLWQPH